jgi:phosphoribosyl 1,2-cyclic phosphodiesterase
MRLTFWGVRGSIPTPGPQTVRYGGNTSCVAVDLGDDMVVFDAGTGIRLLGNHLMQAQSRPRIHLFLSHVHWDHIQGFPFFAPGYSKAFSIVVHGRGQADQTLGQILAGQMEGPNFPVTLAQLDATLAYHDIAPGQSLNLNKPDGLPFAKVQCVSGQHPNGVLIYRLDDLRSGKSIVYATDTEHTTGRIDERITSLAQGADVLIYDGMYTPDEYEKQHRGWGHSTWREGLAIALKAQVKQYVVFHHDPSHDDAFLDALKSEVVQAASQAGPSLTVDLAREGLSIDLG